MLKIFYGKLLAVLVAREPVNHQLQLYCINSKTRAAVKQFFTVIYFTVFL